MGDTVHTPGPWSYDPKSGWISTNACCARGLMHVADVRGWGHLTGGGHGAHGMAHEAAREIQDANARLIAAAPDLLVALQDAYEAEGLLSSDSRAPWFSNAAAIIAKATGAP